ncbi:MAG: phosphohydrolase [Actinobacteria bacterium]|nr:phosphohydrolase [Actinomycetota bacterium]MBI3688463.1 phosphohydrolase [Actinomycetota bacterium]
MGWTVAEAESFVRFLHGGTVDDVGHRLVEHLEAVRERVEEMGGEEVDQVAALLHHIVEDGQVSPARLASLGVPSRATAIVDALTRRCGEAERDQLRRVMATPGAVRVLRADLAHQLHPDQLLRVPGDERERTLHRCCRILDELDKEPELTFW